MSRRALLLVNRNSRQGSSAADQLVPLLHERGLELTEESAPKPPGLSELIRRYKDRVDLVIVVGGDGTLNAAADGLAETGLPLGLIPTGTANDLARTLGVPTDLAAACEVIANGQLRTIDLGCVNGKHYFNVASLGLTVRITQQLTKEVKSRWGVFAYLLTAMRVVICSRPFHATIRFEEDVLRVKTAQIAVGNGRHYGGGMTVADDAVIDDGLLDLYSLEIRHWWQIIPLLPAMRRGDLAASPHVRTLRGREFEVVTRSHRRVNTDGELTTKTPAQFRIVPGAVRVYVPNTATSADGLSGP